MAGINKNYKERLILLVIYCAPKLSNSYDLLKVLEWKFGFFDPRNTINNLVKSDMLFTEVEGRIKNYIITQKGIEYLKHDIDILKNEFYSKFPKQEKFLNILFKSSSLNEEE